MRSLDELLGDKAALDGEIAAHAGRDRGHGVRLLGVGIKDVILPGEMKEILNGVVLAEKQAQASVIRRREEGQRHAITAQHRKADRGQPGADALERAGGTGEGHREDRHAHRVRRLDGVLKQLVTIR